MNATRVTCRIDAPRADGGTELVAVHDGLPPGRSAAANETGWRVALDRLAALTETAA